MIIRKKNLLATMRPGLLSNEEEQISVVDPEPSSIVEEAANDVNANTLDGLGKSLAALEELQEVRKQLAEQVAQNDVNLAAVQGEDTPEVGSDFQILNTEGRVVDTVPAPDAELSANSTPEDIVSKTLDTEAALEYFSARITKARANSNDGIYNVLGIRRSTFGIEDINKDPLAAYKESCEGLKDILNSLGSVIRKSYGKVVDFLTSIKEGILNRRSDYKYLLNKVQGLNPSDYRIKEGNAKIDPSILFVLSNKGVGSVTNPVNGLKTIVNGYIKFCTTSTPSPLQETPYSKSLKQILIKHGAIDKTDVFNDDILIPADNSGILAVNSKTYRVRELGFNNIDTAQLLPATVEERLELCKNVAKEGLSNYDAIIKLGEDTYHGVQEFFESYQEVRHHDVFGRDITDDTGKTNYNNMVDMNVRNDGKGNTKITTSPKTYARVVTKHKLKVDSSHANYDQWNNIMDGYVKLSHAAYDNYNYVPMLIKQILATLEKNV